MKLISRVMRSVQNFAASDNSFETYYGSIVRKQDGFGPTADEARRDFLAAKSSNPHGIL